MKVMIYLAADHRGFELKEKLKEGLKDHGYTVKDLGAHELLPNDDYPDYAFAVAKKVSESPDEHRGILLCGSGIGMDIAANKIKGIRATVAWDAEAARAGRNDDDINVIAISADRTSPQDTAEIVHTFLETKFLGEERYVRRINKINSS